jgi:DNA polymerase-3 subunit gamma/tau
VQRFDFRPIAPEALARSLERILTEEKIAFEPAALPVVVRAADGSLRDALSLLDTAIAYGQGRLEAATVAELLGTTAPADVRAFAEALLTHDAAGALEAIDRTARDGEDLGGFVRDVVELLRRALVLKAAPSAQLADLTTTEANALRKLGETASLDEILYILRAFLDADEQMRESPHPRVELEIAAVRSTRRPVPQAVDDILRRIDEAQSRLGQYTPAASAPAPVQENLLGSAPPRPVVEPRRPAPPAAAPIAPAAVPAPPPAAVAQPREAASSPVAESDLAIAWQRVVDEVMGKKPMLGAVLAQARPLALADGELTVAVTGNHFQRELLADRGNRELVVAAVRRWVRGADRLALSEGEAGAAGITSHPAVQAAIAEFEGEVVAVRRRSPEGESQ